MNANKPDPPAGSAFASRFTERVANHPRVAYYLHPTCQAPVLFVLAELLVADDVLAGVIVALNTPAHPTLVVPTQQTVFGEGPGASLKNDHIHRLPSTPGDQA